MFTTIITDCSEPNEALRPITRFNSLGLGPTSLLGINSGLGSLSTIEGGLNLIDILDASLGQKGIVFLNVAPRGNKKDGANGTKFSYFYNKETLVISTIKEYCLSFVAHLKIAKSVEVLELQEVLNFAVERNLIGKNLATYITNSQFRSFDFVPRLARWLIEGHLVPSTTLDLSQVPLPNNCAWCVDAFGNVKTTLISNGLILKGKSIDTNLGKFKYYERLKDIPFGKTGIYTGSSGIGKFRFLELATQGITGSASRSLNIKVGDTIEIVK